jgi:hypothetical protein
MHAQVEIGEPGGRSKGAWDGATRTGLGALIDQCDPRRNPLGESKPRKVVTLRSSIIFAHRS